ncbi:MAG TPA: YibE/F family protein [Actinomycetota bacterium]|nr:YibE/F family protein [Actinomycetota bacterium]
MSHSHSHVSVVASVETRRRLFYAVAPFLVATVIGLIVLWPSGEDPDVGAGPVVQYNGTVREVEPKECAGGLPGGENFECARVTALVEQGPDAGDEITFETAEAPGVRKLRVGDKIRLGLSPDAPPELRYYFADYQRRAPLLLLGLIFGVVVVALSRWRGLAAIVGLGISLLILLQFVLPAILQGSSPLAVAIVGSAAIMFVTLYLAHGFTARTSTAVLGTLISLALTGILAVLFVAATKFTGLASEEATFLQVSADQINLEGLILGGIIIGTLGVLDDVTITQASAVWELHIANPAYTVRQLYGSAVRIGRDHIASTVNTLVLAYAGASLPLLIVFSLSARPLGDLLTAEIIAEEIVRTLVGSIGLVASVPITTLLTAIVVSRDAPRRARTQRSPEPEPEPEPEFRRPKAEEEWRA